MSGDKKIGYDPDDYRGLPRTAKSIEEPGAKPDSVNTNLPLADTAQTCRGISPKKPTTKRPTPAEIAYDPDGDGNRHPFGGGMLR